jgi:hypothetical protein
VLARYLRVLKYAALRSRTSAPGDFPDAQFLVGTNTMASNKDLITSILAVSVALALDAPETDEKTNAELSEMLKELKVLEQAKTNSDSDEDAPDYVVNAGKAITSKRGILADGDEIEAKDLAGGDDALQAFVVSGHIKKA